MKRALITGTYGFLGRHTAKKMKEDGYYVVGIGHGKWLAHEYKEWGIDEWYSSTITFESLINLNQKFEVIVHCGGGGSVGFSYENPYEDFQKSVQSTLSLLEYIRLQCKNCHFIYPSSPAVQGDLGNIKIKEEDPSNPVSPYGYHKKAAEELCYSYVRNFDLKVTIIRFFSIYGPGLQKQLLWDACIKIKDAIKEVSFFGTGEETRDWVNIKDATLLISALVKKNDFIGINLINCGSGAKTTIKETLDLLVNLYNKEVVIKFDQRIKQGDPRFYHADIAKAKQLTWEPTVSLAEGLKEYLNFFKKLMND